MHVYLPIGPIAPYGQVAVGAFVPTNVGSAGFFCRGGAGLMWFANSYVGVGAELSYNRAGDANIVSIVSGHARAIGVRIKPLNAC